MKSRVKILILTCLLLVVIAFGTYQTYAYLTQTKTIEYSYKIDSINATVTVTGDATVSGKITNNDLAYIHYTDDVILNKYKLLGKMASVIKVDISFQNNFYTRVKVQVPEDTYGLLYLVIDDSEETINKEVEFKVENKTLYSGFVEADGTVTNWTEVISGLEETLTNDELRTLVNQYNTSKLTELYENELFNPNDAKTFKFRVLIWGDYYDLTDADKEVYLTKSYNLELTAKVIQAKDQYGGTLDYEND
jgi:hypothetical protein